MSATSAPRRRLAALLGSALLLTLAPAAQAAVDDDQRHSPRPETYTVSTTPGENLEGIEVTRDGTMYVTSVATGAVYKGDVRDDTLEPWLPAGSDGRDHAAGVHVDRWGRVLVAGAFTGKFFVYDPDGTLLAVRSVPGEAMINDFAIARGHVYVTDAFQGTVWRAPISRSGIGELEPYLTADDFTPAASFLNGIDVLPGGRGLLVSDWDTDVTHKVSLRTGETTPVEVTGGNGVFSADGLLVRGHTAHGVYTDWEAELTYLRTVRFNHDFTRARIVSDSDAAGFDDSPTTVAFDRGRLLWVNSQLNVDPSDPPFTVTEVPYTGRGHR